MLWSSRNEPGLFRTDSRWALQDGNEVDLGGRPVVDEQLFASASGFINVLPQFHQVIPAPFVVGAVSPVG